MPILDPFETLYEDRPNLVAAWKAIVFDKFLEGVGEAEHLTPFEAVFYSASYLKLEYQRILNLPDAAGLAAASSVLVTLFRSDYPPQFWRKFECARTTTGPDPRYFVKALDLYRSAVNDFLVLWLAMNPVFSHIKLSIESDICRALSELNVKLEDLRALQKTYYADLVLINRIPFSLESAVYETHSCSVFNETVKSLLAYRNLKPLIELTEELDNARGFCRILKEKIVTYTKYTPPTSGDLLVLFYEAQRVVNWYHHGRFGTLGGTGPLATLMSGKFMTHGKELPAFISAQLAKMDSYCVTFPPAAFSQFCPTEPPIPSEYRFSDTDIPCMVCKDPVHVGVSAFCLNPECGSFNSQMKALVHYPCFTPLIWSAFYKDNSITWKLGEEPPNAPCPVCREPIETTKIKFLMRTVIVLPPSVRKRLTPEPTPHDTAIEAPPKKQKVIDLEQPELAQSSVWDMVTEDHRPPLQ